MNIRLEAPSTWIRTGEARDAMLEGRYEAEDDAGMKQKAAFTLMELLVVLAVIMILMGILFPALMGARERAKITRARSEAQALQQAWLTYWTTYEEWPGGVTKMNDAAVEILGGSDSSENRLEIAFMEFDERQYVEGFKDPWGELYQIELNTVSTNRNWSFQTRAHCANKDRYKY